MRTERRRPAEIAWVGGAVLLFVFLATLKFESPGSTWDGTRITDKAWQMWECWRSGDYAGVFQGYRLYHGHILSYLLLPGFMAAEGPSRTWAQLSNLLLNVGTLLLSYGAARSVFPRAVAGLMLLLLAVHPPFVMGTKVFIDATGAVCFFPALVLFLAARAWALRKPGYLWAAAFCAGWGLGTYLWFAEFLAALGLAAWLFRREISSRLRVRTWPLAALALIPGIVPIVCHELTTRYPSWGRLASRANEFPPGTVLHNLLNYDVMMSSAFYFREFFGRSDEFLRNPWYGPLALAAAAWLAARAAFGRPAFRKGTLFLLTTAAGTFALVVISPAVALKLFILYPFPQLFLALAARDVFSLKRRAWSFAAAAGLLTAAATEARALGHYVRLLQETGGARLSTDAVYDLADWLNVRVGERDLIVGHEFLTGSLRLLLPPEKMRSARGVLSRLHAPPEERERALESVRRLTRDFPRVFFLRHKAEEQPEPDPAAFELLKEFRDRDGTVVLRAYRPRARRSGGRKDVLVGQKAARGAGRPFVAEGVQVEQVRGVVAVGRDLRRGKYLGEVERRHAELPQQAVQMVPVEPLLVGPFGEWLQIREHQGLHRRLQARGLGQDGRKRAARPHVDLPLAGVLRAAFAQADLKPVDRGALVEPVVEARRDAGERLVRVEPPVGAEVEDARGVRDVVEAEREHHEVRVAARHLLPHEDRVFPEGETPDGAVPYLVASRKTRVEGFLHQVGEPGIHRDGIPEEHDAPHAGRLPQGVFLVAHAERIGVAGDAGDRLVGKHGGGPEDVRVGEVFRAEALEREVGPREPDRALRGQQAGERSGQRQQEGRR
jgi:hypothetical protein